MRLAIISDTHFGDSNCTLVTRDGNGNYLPGARYDELRAALGGKVDYLVLAGDIFDFSIAHYEEAYGYARAFFQYLKDEDLVESIVYLAGNHDADMWYTQLQQVHVVDPVRKHRPPKEFRHAVPAIIDDRTGAESFSLQGIKAHPRAHFPYGGLFLDYLTKPVSNFNFAFPNLYIVTDRESVLVTHGHYLETYWSFLGGLLPQVAAEDLGLDARGRIDIGTMAQLNFPFNQLACSGLGQAGILTDRLVRPLEIEIKAGDLRRTRKYLRRLQEWLAGKLNGDGGWCGCCRRVVGGWALTWARRRILALLAGVQPARRPDFAESAGVMIEAYYRACLLELETIDRPGSVKIPSPNRIIYGHTHVPAGWDDNREGFDLPAGVGDGTVRRVTLHNTGGWLHGDDGRGRFGGAEVFLYESGAGFSSVRIE